MNSWDFILFLSLIFPNCDAWSESRIRRSAKDTPVVCYDNLMSVYLSKEQFSNLPLTIYVQDERGGYYQAAAIANHCHYFFGETHTSVILTVAFHGCFVKRYESTTSLTVVIVAPGDGGVPEIVHSMKVECETEKREANKFPDVLKEFFCNKNGFNITIPRNATDPPLNLDAIWIPSDPNHNCKPQKRSIDAVTYSFPFTDCGTQSKVDDGNITYWIIVEVKRYPQRGVIIRDTPFRLTVKCSFALTQMTQLGFDVQQKADYPSALKNKGVLRTEMRFAKDSSYRSFYSSGDPPRVAELGQLVFVEVFLKHQDKDLVLLLEDCWATPTEDPHDLYRWNLLVKGCPFSGDTHRTVLLPVSRDEVKSPALHKWLVVKLFSFVKPPTFENLVYFHCSVEICKGPNCIQSCSSDNRKLRGISPEQGQRIFPGVVSGEPLLYLQ